MVCNKGDSPVRPPPQQAWGLALAVLQPPELCVLECLLQYSLGWKVKGTARTLCRVDPVAQPLCVEGGIGWRGP